MNTRIITPLHLGHTAHDIEILAPGQPFFHTNIQILSDSSFIRFTRIDLHLCTIWLAHYNTNEPVIFQYVADNPAYQLSFHYSGHFGQASEDDHSMKNTFVPVELKTIYPGKTKIRLSNDHFHSLYIHYQHDFFSPAENNTNSSLLALFETERESKPNIVHANAAITSVLRQIINASPANRMARIFLDAKVKELITLVYMLALPKDPGHVVSHSDLASIEKAREIITRDLAQSYSIFELAKMAGTNPFSLKENFKKHYGIPIHLFLHNTRMEKATNLLLTTNFTVKEIAFAIGYKNLSNFSESFKKHYGYPPKKLREAE